MNSTFLQAAASYFGMGEADIRKGEWFTDGPDTLVVFELRITDNDLIGVMERMKEMRAAEHVLQDELPGMDDVTQPTREEMRAAYDAMTPGERGRFGSFAKFMAYASQGVGGREVQHVDVEQIEEPSMPEAVWLTDDEATPAQKQFASLIDPARGYLVQVAMLDEAQFDRYVRREVNLDQIERAEK